MFDIIQERFRDFRMPILCGIAITRRCNQKCLYCQVWDTEHHELKTKEALSIIKQLSELGMHRFCLTGGEPLLREDIGRIINFAYNKNMKVEVSSNGSLVKNRISDLKGVQVLCISLDGPEHIHDSVRGRGSFKKVIEAADIARKKNIAVSFRSVISKMNFRYVDAILNIAKDLKMNFIFQPVTPIILGTHRINPLAASLDEYRQAFAKLIAKKEKGNKFILNSLAGLKYFYGHLHGWPKPKKMFCISGRVLFHIDPDGMLYPCINGSACDTRGLRGRDCLKLGVKEAIRSLRVPDCAGCWNAASFELNYSVALLLKKQGNFLSGVRYFC